MIVAAYVLAILGCLITAFNFYCSVLRYLWFVLRRKKDDYKWVSGIPIYGSLFLWLAAAGLAVAGARTLALLALCLTIFDNGGLRWFAVAMLVQAIKKK